MPLKCTSAFALEKDATDLRGIDDASMPRRSVASFSNLSQACTLLPLVAEGLRPALHQQTAQLACPSHLLSCDIALLLDCTCVA